MAAPTYDVHYRAIFEPKQDRVEATIEVRQSQHALRVLDFYAPATRFSDFRGDGDIERDGKRVTWELPENGGKLTYYVDVDHKRGQRFDARLEPSWAAPRRPRRRAASARPAPNHRRP